MFHFVQDLLSRLNLRVYFLVYMCILKCMIVDSDILLNLEMLFFRNALGSMISLEAKLDLSNTDYKNTPKLTWLADTSNAPSTPTVCVHFENLITKGVLKPDEDFRDYANRDSKVKIINI